MGKCFLREFVFTKLKLGLSCYQTINALGLPYGRGVLFWKSGGNGAGPAVNQSSRSTVGKRTSDMADLAGDDGAERNVKHKAS
jgi:hypothetical protein